MTLQTAESCGAGTCSNGQCQPANGQSPPACNNNCDAADQPHCDGNYVTQCKQDSNGCLNVHDQSCGDGTCSNGQCHPTCMSFCPTIVSTDPSQDSVHTWDWVRSAYPMDCGACGASTPACTNECTKGAAECDTGAKKECILDPTTGCTQWKRTACANGCRWGECLDVACSTNCNYVGQTSCDGNSALTCVQVSGGCLNWQSTSCGTGTCSNGQCQPAGVCDPGCAAGVSIGWSWNQMRTLDPANCGGCPVVCSDQCILGSSLCSGSAQIRNCVVTSSGCTDWKTTTCTNSCASGHCQPPGVCDPGCATGVSIGWTWDQMRRYDPEHCGGCVGQDAGPCKDQCVLGSGFSCYGSAQIRNCAMQSTGCTDWNISDCSNGCAYSRCSPAASSSPTESPDNAPVTCASFCSSLAVNSAYGWTKVKQWYPNDCGGC